MLSRAKPKIRIRVIAKLAADQIQADFRERVREVPKTLRRSLVDVSELALIAGLFVFLDRNIKTPWPILTFFVEICALVVIATSVKVLLFAISDGIKLIRFRRAYPNEPIGEMSDAMLDRILDAP